MLRHHIHHIKFTSAVLDTCIIVTGLVLLQAHPRWLSWLSASSLSPPSPNPTLTSHVSPSHYVTVVQASPALSATYTSFPILQHYTSYVFAPGTPIHYKTTWSKSTRTAYNPVGGSGTSTSNIHYTCSEHSEGPSAL